MTGGHWTDDELLEHLYGLRPADAHFVSCEQCAARLKQAADRRAQVTADPEIPAEFLAAQRRGIYQRLGSPAGWHPLRWALPLAMTAALAIGLTLYRAERPQHPLDDSFYTEISSIDQNPAPRAVQPIEALVDEEPQE